VAKDAFRLFWNGLQEQTASSTPLGPQAGGRVHFSGALIGSHVDHGHVTKAYSDDEFGEYVGIGEYPDNSKAFPKSIRCTFDSVAVDAGTRVTIFRQKNFQGEVLWDRVGPAIINNVIWKGNSRNTSIDQPWPEPLQSIFPQSVREWSDTDMHQWNTGSLMIRGGEAIPQKLKDSVPEYARLSNPTY